jgi:cell division transport system permease protein
MALLLALFTGLTNLLDSIELNFSLETLLILFGSLIILGSIITLVSTWISLNKYLRMKLDDLY